MIAFLRSWLLGLIGAAMFCALAAELTPAGGAKKVQKLLCGVLLALALLLPLLRLQTPDYALDLARWRESAAGVTQGAEEISREMNRRVIEERLNSYILDKAQTLGAPLSAAEVSLRWSTEGLWYPVEVKLHGAYSAALADWIAAELGIDKDAQSWEDG